MTICAELRRHLEQGSVDEKGAGLMTTSESERIGGAPTAFRLARDRDSRERIVALQAEQRVISADSHVIEPGDLWTTHITQEFRDRAPHIESRATMPDGTVEDGQFLVIEGSGPAARGWLCGDGCRPAGAKAGRHARL